MADTISVPGYSSDNLVPGFYFALDASKANTATVRRRVLVIGQMLDTALGKPDIAVECAGVTSAQGIYGMGSQIAIMVEAYRKIDPNGELWILPLSDPKTSKATGSLQLGGTATQSGKISFYIGDQLIEQFVSSGDSAAIIAKAISDRINAVATVPVQASVKDSLVNITAKNAGQCGNDIALKLNLLGDIAGQILPTGITATINPMQNGVGVPPTLSSSLAGLGQRQFDLFIHPYADLQSLSIFSDLLNDQSGRWQTMDMLYGHSITAMAGTYGQVTALADRLNDQHMTLMASSDSPTHPMIWAAQVGAHVAVSMRNNPAVPITGLILNVMPPSDLGCFTLVQRNSLLYDGVSTFIVNDNNDVAIERLVTTYKRNAYGNDDNSYRNIETVLTAALSIQDMKQYLASQFPRCVLLRDGSKISAGQQATTAELIGKTCIARYRTQAGWLWVQDTDGFSKELKAEYAGNGTVKLLMPYRFSDQLFIIAGNCQFIKG
ncbi:Mu-like prophage tail sheath protein gpL (gpL) [Commensalibacter communis]|uniref:Mu-like prophage tail sheath protein gpL (GpL) n=1 Tax=Commensalibacter communis TaxID=2972786 RepID=A0A9W4TN20_9PROT|nr:phage tail sheath subtilisin-like domain-containing protein [Commensalibacter communis]CAI3953491.1 Mu-like prophage tail sheath protein gpL (gpL) [Commensalibacter communis]CAI3956560.1 Mu-like prophage tail sheath protein gpL (gpL) [Commensalibacter communis]CAI3956719.1 Mu-like prophage tail sheath protein gpL (gpL) [Commensalibacter communis]CAI3957101.1 Mu-like prophage tail sheath protein gpL (gpL) [Commensalibacter communis]